MKAEMFIAYDGNEYGDGILVEKYGDAWSLVSARVQTKGEGAGRVHKRWCYPEKKAGSESVPSDKPLPWKIYLGQTPEEAVAMLRKIAVLLMPTKSSKGGYNG